MERGDVGQQLHGHQRSGLQQRDPFGFLDISLAAGHGAKATPALAGYEEELGAFPLKPAFDEFRPVQLSRDGCGQAGRPCRQAGLGIAHQPVQAWQGKLQESHLVRRGAAREDEDRLSLPQAEAGPFAGPEPDPVVQFAPPQLVQDPNHQVALAAPGATAGDHGIVPCERFQQRGAQDGRIVRYHRPSRLHPVVTAPSGHGGQVAGEDLA